MIDEEIREYIQKKIIPLYNNFDLAHRADHAEYVIKESLFLANFYDVNKNMVLVIAAFHDLGLINGRDNHHIDSAKILCSDEFVLKHFNSKEIIVMQEAVEDHRASNDYAPRSIYGKIVAEADRVLDYQTVILRTIQYGKDKYPHLNKEEQFVRLHKHLKNKYDYDGYIKLWIPYSDNESKLSKLREIINNEEQCYCIFEKLYQ